MKHPNKQEFNEEEFKQEQKIVKKYFNNYV